MDDGWRVIRHDLTQRVAVVPEEDLVHHVSLSENCICGPAIEFENGWLILTHASLDGRELVDG